MDNADVQQKCVELLEKLDVYDQVEVISNILIYLGLLRMTVDEDINVNNIVDIVLSDRKKNGETIYNALAQQGIVMNFWLKNNNK